MAYEGNKLRPVPNWEPVFLMIGYDRGKWKLAVGYLTVGC